MDKYKQGYSDRKDESMGELKGKKDQSYKSRRDESYGMSSAYDNKHEKSPSKINAIAAQKSDMGRMQERKMQYRGTPMQAYGYKY